MSDPTYRVVRLSPDYDLAAFDCGAPAYNIEQAISDKAQGSERVYRIAAEA